MCQLIDGQHCYPRRLDPPFTLDCGQDLLTRITQGGVRGGTAQTLDTTVDTCSGLMKPDTHLGENARQIEVSDDQTTSFLSAEFKREAAGLVLDQGYSHTEASRSLGVVESALRRWVNQLQQERSGVTPQSKALTPEQQKIQELEARIARLEREKSILKKATALLMSEEHERTR